MSAALIEQVNQLQADLSRSNALLAAIQATAIDGILIADQDRRVIFYNQQFYQLWRVPEPTVRSSDCRQLLPQILDQLVESDNFLARIEYLYQHPNLTSRDEIALKDGRTLDRYSAPVCLPNGEYFARVWYYRDITERKQTEQMLQASESQYRDLVETSNSIILRWDIDGNVRFVNDYGQQFFGFSTDELINRNIDETIVPKTESSGRDLQQMMANVCQYPEQYLLNENENVCKNGDRVWISWANKPIFDRDGNLIEILSVGTDATERKRTQLALQRSEAQLQAILDNAPAGIFAKDLEGRYIFANRWVSEEVGVPIAQILGKTDADLLPPDVAQMLQANDRLALETGKPLRIEEVIASPAGEHTYLAVKFLLLDQFGEPYAICGISTDITDLKRTEAALRESEAHLNQLLDHTSASIASYRMYADRRHVLEYFSSGSVQLWGFTPEELLADIEPWLARYEPADLQAIMDVTFDHIFNEVPYTYEYRYHHPNSSLRWIEYSLVSYRDESEDCWRAATISTDITDRKRAEISLASSEVRFRRIVENASDMITTVTLDGIITYMSPAGISMLGYSSDELLGQHFAPMIHPDDLPVSITAFNHVIATGEHYPMEHRLVSRDGSIRYVITNASMYEDENGNPVSLGIMRDITDRKRLEEDLRQSQQFLDSVINSIPLSIFVKDIANDFRYVLINNNSEKIMGFPKEGAIGLNDHDLLPLEQAAHHRREDLEMIERRSAVDLPEQWIGDNQRERVMMRGWKLPLFDDRGDMTHILAISEDVTARRQGEQALRLIMEGTAAATGDEFFRSCVRFLVEVLGVRHAVVTEFADAAKTKLRTLANWTGDRFGENFEFNIASAASQTVLKGRTCYYPEAVQTRFPDDAELRSIGAVSYLGVPLINASGEVLGHLAVVDIQPMADDPGREPILKIFAARAGAELDRKHAEQALQTAKDAAEAANRAKSAFLANMSHELRTPLNAILGFAQLMERDANLSDRQRHSLATINRSGEHLLNLINDVLEMSKIEAGRIVLNVAPFDLHQLLQTLEELFQARAQSKHLSLTFAIDPHLPRYILADEGKLRQVLINLLGNAVKFTELGGVTLRAEARSHPDCTLHFEIVDTGRGIAPDEQDNLFQPFVQTVSGTQAQEGTGLGLTISRQFIHLMGGEIDFISTLAQGSTFFFDIRVTLADAIALATVQRRIVRLAEGQPTYRILVVDDRPENCDLLTQLLKLVGFETQIATNGQEAIAQWQSWQPHLIWMDMRMPVIDGYDATRRIRQAQTQSTTPKILALTASAFEEQQSSILAAGCDDFIRKPFRESIIFEKMAEHLGVQYVYVVSDAVDEAPTSSLVPASLQMMPTDWLADLRQAAFAVDGDRLLQLIEQIPAEERAIANQLSELVRRFCFDEILELMPEE